jgi:fibronectin type 3 domain-containing protein
MQTGVLIQAEHFDQGGQGVAYQTTYTKNPGSVYRSTGAGIVADADVDQGYKIAYTAAGQWYAYTINVAQAGSYRIDYRLASSQTSGGRFHFEIDGVNVTGTLTAPNTGSYATYQTLSSGNFNLTVGAHVLKLVMDAVGNGGAIADFNWMQITPAATPLVPTNLSLAAASSTELDLNWSSSDATVSGFQILRQTAGGTFAQIATVGAATRSYADTGLATNTNYGYEVVAMNSSGSSLFAGPLTATTPTPPGAATNFAEKSATTSTITLTWTAPAGATGYQIFRQVAEGSATLLATLGSGVTSYVDSGLTAGTTYQYTLTASNVGGTGGSASAGAPTMCLAPASTTAKAASGQITLTWASVEGASSYDVYRGTIAGGESATPIAPGISGTSYIDPGLSAGTIYYYVVRAVNSAGTSAASSESSAQLPYILPTAPSLSIATGVGQIVLTWSGGANAQSYNIYRASQVGAEAAGLLASGVTENSYSDSSVQAGATYYYIVTSVNTVGESSFSNEVHATASIVTPPAPSGLIATVAGNRVTLSWNGVDTAMSYLVYRGTSAGGESATPFTVSGTSYIDESVVAGKTYFYEVAAVNLAGGSDLSNEASATIANALPLTTTAAGKVPATMVAGQAKPFSQTVTFINSSKSTVTQTLTTRWYLSASPTIGDSAIALPGIVRKTVKLKSGARMAIVTRVSGIPSSIAAGSYFLIAQTTDAMGAVSTTVSGKTITIAAPNVALQAAFSGMPHSITAGKSLVVSIRISNLGNVAANGALPTEFSIADTSGDVLQTVLSKHVIHIAAGKSALLRLTVKLPVSLPSQIVLNATLSPDGAIAHARGDAISISNAAISVITRSGVR